MPTSLRRETLARVPTGRAEWSRAVAPPLLAWALAALTLTIAAWRFGYDPFDSATWWRWDSEHYESIARDGYDLFACPQPPFRPGTWCGDAGWFPAYSWLVGGLHLLGLPLRGTGVAVSWLFTAATLVLIWNTFLERRLTVAAIGALLFAAFAPGMIYGYAIFPLSLLAFCTVAHLWLLHRARWLGAGIAGAVAALAYPLGVVLVPVSAVWILTRRHEPLRARLRHAILASGLTALGVCVFFVDQWVETGRWNAYFLVQDKYGHEYQSPLYATRQALDPLLHDSPLELATAPALQTALVTAFLAAVAAAVLVAAARRRRVDRLDALVLVWALATWAVPLSQTNVSILRSQAALLPIAVLAPRLPRFVLLAALAGTIVLAVVMEKLFLQGVLV
jgi:hypothetical protein